MAYESKNFRLKISIRVHSKNTRLGSGLLCSGWMGSGV